MTETPASRRPARRTPARVRALAVALVVPLLAALGAVMRPAPAFAGSYDLPPTPPPNCNPAGDPTCDGNWLGDLSVSSHVARDQGSVTVSWAMSEITLPGGVVSKGYVTGIGVSAGGVSYPSSDVAAPQPNGPGNGFPPNVYGKAFPTADCPGNTQFGSCTFAVWGGGVPSVENGIPSWGYVGTTMGRTTLSAPAFQHFYVTPAQFWLRLTLRNASGVRYPPAGYSYSYPYPATLDAWESIPHVRVWVPGTTITTYPSMTLGDVMDRWTIGGGYNMFDASGRLLTYAGMQQALMDANPGLVGDLPAGAFPGQDYARPLRGGVFTLPAYVAGRLAGFSQAFDAVPMWAAQTYEVQAFDGTGHRSRRATVPMGEGNQDLLLATDGPTVTATANQVAGAPRGTTRFAATPGAGTTPVAYRWTFSDGTTALGATVDKVVPKGVNLSARVRATDANGAWSEAQAWRYVESSLVVAQLNLAYDQFLAVGRPATGTITVRALESTDGAVTVAPTEPGGVTISGAAHTVGAAPSMPASVTLQPNEARTFPFTFTPTETGRVLGHAGFTVTEPDGSTMTLTSDDSRRVSTADLAVSITTDDGSVPVGGTRDATIVLRNPGQFPVDVTILEVSTRVAGDISDTVLRLDAGAEHQGVTSTVAAGSSTSLPVRLAGVGAGEADLYVELDWTSEDIDGRVVRTSSARTFNVIPTDFPVTLTVDPTEVTLTETDDGPQPKEVTATVEVHNTTGGTLRDVRVVGLTPSFEVGTTANGTAQPRDIVQVPDEPTADAPRSLGDLADGERTTLQLPVVVRDDGTVVLTARVEADVDGADAPLSSKGTATLVSKPEYYASFELDTPDRSYDDGSGGIGNTPDVVEAPQEPVGPTEGRWRQGATVTNLTTDTDVLVTIPVSDSERAQGVHLTGTDGGDGLAPYREVIGPGETKVLSAFPMVSVATDRGEGPYSARVTYAPDAAVKADEADEAFGAASADKVRVRGNGPTASVPVVPPTLPEDYLPDDFASRFTIGYVEGGIKYVSGIGAAAASVAGAGAHLTVATFDPRTYFRAGQAIVGFAGRVELAYQVWTAMSEQERAALLDEVAGELGAFLAKADPRLLPEKVAQLRTALDGALVNLFAGFFEKPWEQIAQDLGGGTAFVVGEVTVGMLTDAAFAKLVSAARSTAAVKRAEGLLAEAAGAARLKIEKGLTGYPIGAAISDAALAFSMGIDKIESNYLHWVAKRNGVKIYPRSRSAGSIALLRSGEALPKPMIIKAKNVSDIDKAFLGFDLVPKDIVAIREPLPWDEVLAKMNAAGLDAGERKLVAKRWKTRMKEWWGDGGEFDDAGNLVKAPVKNQTSAAYKESARAQYLQWNSDGAIDVGFRTDGNFEETNFGQGLFPQQRRRFEVRYADGDAGAIIPMYADGGGILRKVTGDIDIVAITMPDGSVPPQDVLLQTWLDLAAPPVSAQHPATLTWMNDKYAKDFLTDHMWGNPAAEPLAEFAAEGPARAVLFSDKLSLAWADRSKAGGQFLYAIGGQFSPPWYQRVAAGSAGAFLPPALDQTRPYYPPSGWDQAAGGVTMDRNAPITQQGSLTQLQTFQNGAWTPAPPAGVAVTPGRARLLAANAAPLTIGVQSAVARAAAAGDRRIAVLGLAQLFPGGTEGQQWFADGDQVVVDPGGPQQWVATVATAEADGLTFTEPLPTGLLAGTMVAKVVPGSLAVPNRAPSAAGDTATVAAGEAVVIDVLGNDVDPDGDVLAVDPASVTTAGASIVSVAGRDHVRFAPGAVCPSPVSFAYTALDGRGGSATATVEVTVTCPPLQAAAIASEAVDEGATIAVRADVTGAVGPTTVLWDLDADGAFDDASGVALTLVAPNGPATRTAQAWVLDGAGRNVSSNTAATAVRNTAPTGTLAVPASVAAGARFTVAVTGATDVAADVAGLRIAVDCGTGTFGSPTAAGVLATTCTAPATAAALAVRAQLSDADGGVTTLTGAVTVTAPPPPPPPPPPVAGCADGFAGAFPGTGWTGQSTAFTTVSGQLRLKGVAGTVLRAGCSPGADQAASVRLVNFDPLTDVGGLVLRATPGRAGQAPASGVTVVYSPLLRRVVVTTTWSNGSRLRVVAALPAVFAPGDVLGATFVGDRLQVLRNGSPVAGAVTVRPGAPGEPDFRTVAGSVGIVAAGLHLRAPQAFDDFAAGAP